MPDSELNRGVASALRRYTCMYCNKSYPVDDPEFAYYHEGRFGRWEGQLLDGREGRPLDTYGRFAHCVDADACARRRRNVHAGVAPEQLVICDA